MRVQCVCLFKQCPFILQIKRTVRDLLWCLLWAEYRCCLLCLSSLICQSSPLSFLFVLDYFLSDFLSDLTGIGSIILFFLFLLFSMTYYEDDEVVPELTLRIDIDENNNNNKGDYLKLREYEEGEPGSPRRWSCGKVWYWVKLAFFLTSVGLLAAVFIKWVGPFFMDKEVIPIINWETTTFSTPVLAVLVFASVALFPTLLLPSSPSMWVAGMTFGYGFGFLLIMSAVAVGISLPYFIGSHFLHRIQGWLEKYPKKAAILRAAGEGNWFHQFRTVALIRISPFPYIIYNYCAVATHVKYGPYFLGSLVGMVPEIFVTIYTGILIRTLADASHEHHFLSAPQIILNVLGFAASVAATIFFTVYAKRQLKLLQGEGESLLQ